MNRSRKIHTIQYKKPFDSNATSCFDMMYAINTFFPMEELDTNRSCL